MKSKKVYKLILSLFVMVMCVSILLMQIPPKPVEAFAVPLAVPVIVGVGAILAACGYTYYQQGDLELSARALWNNLESGTKTILQNAFDTTSPLQSTVISLNRLAWDAVSDKAKQLFMKDPITYPGITNQTSDFQIYNGNEIYKLTTDTLNWQNISGFVTNKAAGTYTFDFMGTGSIEWTVGTTSSLKMTRPDGAYITMLNGQGTGSTGSVDYLKLVDPVIRTNPTTGMKRLEMYTVCPYNLSNWWNAAFSTPSVYNWNYQGKILNGRIYSLSDHCYIADSTYGNVDIYDPKMSPTSSWQEFLYYFFYGVQTVAYEQDGDYIPGIGIKAMDTLIGAEDDAQILVPPVGAVDDVIGYTPAQAIPDALDDAVPASIDVTLPTEVPITDNPDVEQMKLPIVLMNKFPFCIPFDLAKAFGSLQAAPQSPRFEVPFEIDSLNYSYNFVLDLDDFNGVVKIARWFILLAFIITLIMATRGLIKG